MDRVGGYYSSTDHYVMTDTINTGPFHRHRASTVIGVRSDNNQLVTNSQTRDLITTRGKSQEYYKEKANVAARKLERCGIVQYASEPSKEIFRSRTTSMSSYFLKSSKRNYEKPKMQGTEEFWNQYRRKSSVVSLSTLMKQILFPSRRIKISSLIWIVELNSILLCFRNRYRTILSIRIKESNNYGFLSKIIGSRYQQ